MNDELRVPTIRTAAEVDYPGGSVAGSIFLPTLSSFHPGAPHPEEWINRAEEFFPFLPDGEPGAVILNKDSIRMLTVPLLSDFAIREEDEPFAMPVTVVIGERSISGRLIIEMPEGHSRLLDYMNARPFFIPLWSEQSLHLIRKSCITRIFEAQGV